MAQTILKNNHIQLLPVTKEHEDAFVRLANIPEINARVNKPLVYEKSHFAELIDNLSKDETYYTWMIIKDNDICGVINTAALKTKKIFQGGYWVDPKFQGKGIASEALLLVKDFLFSECGAERIQALVEPDNAASIKVLEKCGYEREGLLRKFYLSKRNGLIDVYMYSVVK